MPAESNQSPPNIIPWNQTDLFAPPVVEPAAVAPAEGLRSVFYEGVPYRDRPTKVFAYIGLPEGASSTHRVPGIVLVHGGGGTAFAYWVRWWNQRGYAAIAMDTCGCVSDEKSNNSERPSHAWAGPRGWGGFDQIDAPAGDQWSYHATATVTRAHTILRHMPEVDPDRIGITGVSWGGYLTCIATALDARFLFSIPVYGCGCLRHESKWRDQFIEMGAERADKWDQLWDPRQYLPRIRTPMLWINGTNDLAYTLGCYQPSYRLPAGERTLCIRLNMHHAHGGAGEKPPEIFAFADAHARAARPLTRITTQTSTAQEISCRFVGDVVRAELIFTDDNGPWLHRKWQCTPAELDRSSSRAWCRRYGKLCYLNLTDTRGLVVSTEHVGPA